MHSQSSENSLPLNSPPQHRNTYPSNGLTVGAWKSNYKLPGLQTKGMGTRVSYSEELGPCLSFKHFWEVSTETAQAHSLMPAVNTEHLTLSMTGRHSIYHRQFIRSNWQEALPSVFLNTTWLCAFTLAKTSAEQELLARGMAKVTHVNWVALAQFTSRDLVSQEEFRLKAAWD